MPTNSQLLCSRSIDCFQLEGGLSADLGRGKRSAAGGSSTLHVQHMLACMFFEHAALAQASSLVQHQCLPPLCPLKMDLVAEGAERSRALCNMACVARAGNLSDRKFSSAVAALGLPPHSVMTLMLQNDEHRQLAQSQEMHMKECLSIINARGT